MFLKPNFNTTYTFSKKCFALHPENWLKVEVKHLEFFLGPIKPLQINQRPLWNLASQSANIQGTPVKAGIFRD